MAVTDWGSRGILNEPLCFSAFAILCQWPSVRLHVQGLWSDTQKCSIEQYVCFHCRLTTQNHWYIYLDFFMSVLKQDNINWTIIAFENDIWNLACGVKVLLSEPRFPTDALLESKQEVILKCLSCLFQENLKLCVCVSSSVRMWILIIFLTGIGVPPQLILCYFQSWMTWLLCLIVWLLFFFIFRK